MRTLVRPHEAPAASQTTSEATSETTAGTDAAPSRRVPSARAEGGFDLDEAWRDHGGSLLGYAANVLGDRHAAEDCVQETFVRAWRARARFSAERSSTRTWLFAIARNIVIDAARSRARRATPVDDAGVARLLPSQPGDQDRVEAQVVVVEALSALSAEHREVLVAVKLEGLTYAELAAHNGVPVATLRTRAFHALRALRTHLDEESDDA